MCDDIRNDRRVVIRESWYDSTHCTTRAACRLCRGRASFREWIVATFDGVADCDFECRYGVTLASLPARPQSPARSLGRARLAICEVCDADCRMKHGKPCERTAVARRPDNHCPRKLWDALDGDESLRAE